MYVLMLCAFSLAQGDAFHKHRTAAHSSDSREETLAVSSCFQRKLASPRPFHARCMVVRQVPSAASRPRAAEIRRIHHIASFPGRCGNKCRRLRFVSVRLPRGWRCGRCRADHLTKTPHPALFLQSEAAESEKRVRMPTALKAALPNCLHARRVDAGRARRLESHEQLARPFHAGDGRCTTVTDSWLARRM